ncbi:MAG: chloride channel protein [Lewinellaceae bacterium]|nr:chloride channel protein [Lewinellaceae bacterium]
MLLNLQKWFRLLRLRLGRGIQWFADHMNERSHQIIVSIIIGIVAGLVATILKFSAHSIREWVYGDDPASHNLGFVVLPVVGVVLTVVYVRYFLWRPFITGLSGLVYAISSKRINIPRDEMYNHVATTALTVGFGGSVGMEAPLVRTGAAIGANVASWLRVGRQKKTLFLACGVAAGLAGIFNSPVAGVIFAIEVLLTDFAVHSFIPLLIAAASGAVVARMLYYEELFILPVRDWPIAEVPYYVLLGVCCGLLSVYMMRMIAWVNKQFRGAKNPWMRLILGGPILGVLIFVFPPLFGEGYSTVNDLLAGNYQQITSHSMFFSLSNNEWFLIAFMAVIVLTKALASAVTIASGGNGGVFAPSMFTGAGLGFVFAHSLNLTGWVSLTEANFTAVAMAGILSGVFKSPLTGIFLIAEATGGYALFVPLMIVSAIAYFIAVYFEPHSIFTRELYRKGLWVPPHERDLFILRNLRLDGLVEQNFTVVHPEQTLGDFVREIAHSKRNVFPVTEAEDGRFLGIILLDDVREVMFKPEEYEHIRVRDLVQAPPAILTTADPMDKVMNIFEQTQAWNLPVVEEGKYQGFVSKSSILNRYREELQDHSAELG